MDDLNITPDWDSIPEIITEAPPEPEPIVTEPPPAETTLSDTEPSEPERTEPEEPIQEPGFTIDPNPDESDVNLDLLYGDIDGSLSVIAGFLQDIKKADEKTAEQFEILAGQQTAMSENSETQLKIFEDCKTFLMYLFIVLLAYGIYRIISGVLNGAFGG